MENGILVEYKTPDDENQLEESQKQQKSKWVPQNVAEYFFFDEFGYVQISEKKVDDCYKEFTETIKVIYNNTKQLYQKFSQKAIKQEDLEIIDFPRVP